MPTTTDVAIFDSNSGVGNSVIGASITVQGLDCTGGTGDYAGTITHNTTVTLTINTGAASSLRFSAGMTYTPAAASSLVTLTHTTGTANITSNGKKLFGLTINGAGGTTQLLDDLLVNAGQIATLTITSGIFDANTHAVTAIVFSATGSTTRSVILGSGVTIGGNVANQTTIWNFTTVTALTFTKNSANITVIAPTNTSGIQQGFAGGGLTYNDVTLNLSTIRTNFVISGANTFAHFSASAGWNIVFPGFTTTTITNAPAITGTQANPTLLQGSNFAGVATISIASGSMTLAWGALQNITATGGATFTATNTFDFGNNSGWSISPPADATIVAPTAAQIAAAVWQDTTAGHFTTALSVGKSLMNGVTLGTGLTVNALTTNNDKTGYALTQSFPSNFASLGISAGGHISNVDTLTTYTGNTVQTGDAYARIGAAGAGLTALGDTHIAHLDADVSSRMATYTQPTGFLAASFPTSVASPTNITAGTITTVTNLTNAPTSGDLTATMKTSVTTAATAATPTAAAVTGAVGSVTGSVGSISGITFPTRFSSLAIDVSGNVTFGNTSIATVTNLTNAPTAGDFTAAMKTSLNAATPAATLSGDFSATMKTSLNAATPAVTVSDKTGFSLASGGLAAVTAWSVAITGNITGNLSGSVGSVTGLTASDVGSIKTTLGTAGAGLTALGDTRIAHLDADVSSRSTFAGGAVASVTGSVGSVVGLTASNLDATISSRLATSSYTAPDNADIAAIKIKTDHLPDSDIVNTLGKLWVLDGAGNAVAPASAIASLPTASQMADEVEVRTLLANIIKVNGVTVNGNGAGTPWGP